MGKRKYDYEQVYQKLVEYLEAGGVKDWRQASKALGVPPTSLREILQNTWPDVGQPLVSEVQVQLSEDERAKKVVALLREGPKTRTELANALDVGPATVDELLKAMIGGGRYEIERRDERIVLPQKPSEPTSLDLIWPSGDELVLAHASDLQFGSIYHQGSALRHFAQYAADHGAEHCLVSGDITAGIYEKRDRQELYAYGADEQVDATCEGIPEVEGLRWYLQGGNHDFTHYTTDGTNVVRRICELRKDCVYVGHIKSDVPLTDKWRARLWHPRGGGSYARSYRGQKGAEIASYDWLNEAVTEEEAAQIVYLQWGHTHYRDLFWYGPMMVFNPGCFEAEYAWLAAGAMVPEIAGLITRTRLSGTGWGSVSEFQWLAYRPAKDDYRPLRHTNILEFEEIEPLFSLKGEGK